MAAPSATSPEPEKPPARERTLALSTAPISTLPAFAVTVAPLVTLAESVLRIQLSESEPTAAPPPPDPAPVTAKDQIWLSTPRLVLSVPFDVVLLLIPR